MRILLYNFVQPDGSSSRQSGGVAIYQKNLMTALKARGDTVINLNSGHKYTVLRPNPRVHYWNDRGIARAEILNSPMFAPAHAAFYTLDAYEDPGLDFIPAELKRQFGRIDVFHFQNIEGLTSGFVRQVRVAFPHARILISAHNYSLVCPQVNLWFREHKVCDGYRDGRACVNCLMSEDRSHFEFRARQIKSVLDQVGLGWSGRRSRAVQVTLRALFYAQRRIQGRRPFRSVPPGGEKRLVILDEKKSNRYRRFRKTNIDLCASVFDKVLAVSERSRQVLIQHGIPAPKISVSYIGTAHSRFFVKAARKEAIGARLHIAYLGYMRVDKGFYFLLESLFSIPDHVARNMSVTIAAPLHDWGAVSRLKGVAHRFHEITVHDGYTHATLDDVLAGVNLGIVPVLWEDNLPQVAIEMVSRGIPILTSDRGGAQEIADNPNFTFKAGSARSLCSKLEEIATGDLPLSNFWTRGPRIISIEDHVDDLLSYYRGDPSPAHIDASPALATV
jgi:glycosyltransferase involved in cell wall biosynthesis